MSDLRHLPRRLKLRYLLFGFFVLYGSLPLIVSSTNSLMQNRQLFEGQERLALNKEAEALSREVSDYILSIRKQLRQLGTGLLTLPAEGEIRETLRQEWVNRYLFNSMVANPDVATRASAVDVDDEGGLREVLWTFGAVNLADVLEEAMNDAFEEVVRSRASVDRFVLLPENDEPAALLAMPVFEDGPGGRLLYVLQGLARLPVRWGGQGNLFLLDRTGEVLWSEGATIEMREAVSSSPLVQEFVQLPANVIPIKDYPLDFGGRTQMMIGRLSPVADTGWGILVQQRKAAAFLAVRQMRNATLLSVVLMLVLALLFAVVATRLISDPIQHLAQTSHEIASGKFGRHVEPKGLGLEMVDLAHSFNLMSDYVQEYIERLQKAARENRDLFIGSIRSFLAAIEAKEPYTRGHSERVASFSQAICRRLSLPRDFQEKIWVAGILHDVGKIGIDDRILKKGEVLTDDEYEEMKRHPVIGAEIMSSIEQLKEMLPAIRWHHEKWNGEGYPDGLKGEQIPLMARIVAVADTFDAVTTQRVYQDPYTPEEAVDIIKRLTATSFDPRIAEAFLIAFRQGDVQVQTPEVSRRPREVVSITEAMHT